MIRTAISLDESDKRWLDQQATFHHVSMAEVVRQAIRALRVTRETSEEEYLLLLASTAGILRNDGTR